MSGLFGGGGRAPDTSKQDAIQAKQEKRTAAQEAEEQRRLAAQTKARQSGGYRSLLSPDRSDAMAGLGRKLGGTE